MESGDGLLMEYHELPTKLERFGIYAQFYCKFVGLISVKLNPYFLATVQQLSVVFSVIKYISLSLHILCHPRV